MSKTVEDIRSRARDEIANAEWSEGMQIHERNRVSQSAQRLGAIRAVTTLGKKLTASAFREFQVFIEENDGENWKTLGYERVVDFLASDDSPMTKNQYYDRVNLINKEEDAVFDLLNVLNVSKRARLLLAAGEIRVDEQEIHVGEHVIPRSDWRQVGGLIETLLESRNTAQDTVAKQAVKIEKGTKENQKLKKERDEARRRSGPVSGTPHGQALLTVLGGYTSLREEIFALRELDDNGSLNEETQAFRRLVIEQTSFALKEVLQAFDSKPEVTNDDDLGITGEEATEMLEG